MTTKPDVNILIVDDDPDLAASLRLYLELRGHDAEAVTAPEAALARLEADRYDIVLSDLMMPGMDGVELLHRIKQRQADAIVVMITASDNLAKVVAARLEGAADYLLKPLANMTDLDAVIDRAVQQVRRWDGILDRVRRSKVS
ncbi:MAG: response regulator [Candidatus Krumholzibacteriia bacterium]